MTIVASAAKTHTNVLLSPLSRPEMSCLSPPQAAAGKLSADGSLQMSDSELQDTMRRLGSSSEERSRLASALSCLKSANETGERWLPCKKVHCVGFLKDV